MKDKLLLIGGGGHCKSVIDSLNASQKYEIFSIVDIKEKIGQTVNDIKIEYCDDDLEALFSKGITNAFVTVGSVGDTTFREQIFKKLKSIGYTLPNIIDKTAVVSETVKLGEGVFVGKNAVINIDTYIDDMAIINTGAIIEHDCKIGKFVHIAPGSVLCGNVVIGYRCHIGANSTIIQGVNINNNNCIGAGSVVIKNIESQHHTYVGNPCRLIK